MNVCFFIGMKSENDSFKYVNNLTDEIINLLSAHNTKTSYLRPGIDFRYLKRKIFEYDCLMLFASDDYIEENAEICRLARENDVPIIFVTDPQNDDNSPYFENSIQYRLSHIHAIDSERLIEILNSCHTEYLDKQKSRKNIVDTNVAAYLKETFQRLKRQDAENRVIGYIMFACSILSLIVGLCFTLNFDIILQIDIEQMDQAVLIHTIFSSVVNALKIALFSAISRLCYIFGKLFMTESTKIRNTIHAISFGDFYLNAYGKDVDRKEVKDILSEWNSNSVNNSTQTAPNQLSDEYDPMVLKLLGEINDLIKNISTVNKPKE